jgi:hypothetical protein
MHFLENSDENNLHNLENPISTNYNKGQNSYQRLDEILD